MKKLGLVLVALFAALMLSSCFLFPGNGAILTNNSSYTINNVYCSSSSSGSWGSDLLGSSTLPTGYTLTIDIVDYSVDMKIIETSGYVATAMGITLPFGAYAAVSYNGSSLVYSLADGTTVTVPVVRTLGPGSDTKAR